MQTHFRGLYLWLLHPMWILHCFRILMITFREIFPKYLKICREYSLNMAEAADFGIPGIRFRNCSDSVVFFIFPFISTIFLLDLGTVLTVWYFIFFPLFLGFFY